MIKNGKRSGGEPELTADELAAALSREISSAEQISAQQEKGIDDTGDFLRGFTLDDLQEDVEEESGFQEDPDDLIRELQNAVDEELRSISGDKEEIVKEDNTAYRADVDEYEEFSEEDFEEVFDEDPEEAEKEPIEEVLEAATEKPVEETVKEPIEEVLEAATEEPVEETVKEPIEIALEAATEEPIEEAAEEPIEITLEAATEEPVEETAKEPIEITLEAATEEPVEETAKEPIEIILEAATEESIDVAVEEPMVELAEETEEEAFDSADTGVIDVSEGVFSGNDALTGEVPVVAASAATASIIDKTAGPELKPVEEEPQKVDKKRQKQEEKEARIREKEEAKEAKLREKQEAKDRKKQEKADKKAEKKAKKKKGVFKVILMFLLLLIVAAAVVYLALSNRYKTVFYDGTLINGADCTGLNVEEAETVVARQLDDYDLTVVFRGGKKELINGESIGFEYIPDGSVQEIKDSQIPVLWLTAFFEEHSYDASAGCSYDLAKLTQVVTALSECNLVEMQAPQDASLSYNEGTKKFEIVPEQEGTKFDLSSLIENIQETVKKGERELNVEELDIYEKPARTKDDPELIRQRDEMNDVISSSVTYTLPTGEEKVLDANILSNWISQDEAGNYYVEPEIFGNHIANFVEDLAKEVNTSDTTVDFTTHYGSTVTLDNYLQGWLIDEEAEGKQLTEELAARAQIKREPIYSQRAYSDHNNGIGNTYVEVDLSAQYLWAVDNGSVVIETPIVSGTMVPSRYTPEGVYPLNGKQAGRWLRGEQYADGSYEYESWVDYWMPFNGGIGLHDASWRADFGGSIYVAGGSHGCVNMPGSKAAAVFDWITTGTPVICYYSGGYSLGSE